VFSCALSRDEAWHLFFIALVGSIAAGLATSTDLTTLFHSTPTVSEFTILLFSYTCSSLYSDISFPQSQGLITILAPNNAAFANLIAILKSWEGGWQ